MVAELFKEQTNFNTGHDFIVHCKGEVKRPVVAELFKGPKIVTQGIIS